jgi:hypothetical protein
MIWTVLVFATGMWCGHYLSPWIEEKLADFMGEEK